MIEHVLSFLLSRSAEKRLNHWVDEGRRRMPIGEDDAFALRFGTRYRAQTILCATIGVSFTALAAWCHVYSEPLGLWLGLAYLLIVFPMTLLAIYLAFHALVHQIDVSRDGLSVRRVFFDDINVPWSSVTSMRWQRHKSRILVESSLRGRILVSTDLDGMFAFAQFASEAPPDARDRSILDWMVEKM